ISWPFTSSSKESRFSKLPLLRHGRIAAGLSFYESSSLELASSPPLFSLRCKIIRHHRLVVTTCLAIESNKYRCDVLPRRFTRVPFRRSPTARELVNTLRFKTSVTLEMHIYEVRPRKDHCGIGTRRPEDTPELPAVRVRSVDSNACNADSTRTS